MNFGIGVSIDLPGSNSQTVSQNFPSFGFLISRTIAIAGVVAGIILVGMAIYTGFLFMSSAGTGDAKRISRAQNSLTTSLIGFLLIFITYFIIQIIQNITGVPILNGTL
ncbi:MAG TPA: hypothetical protein PK131_02015 [Candidatus Woesebacteria bacterium]|nr:hypothetical protein [Candidatus Woesebacteria bacterium]HRS23074.1 hypothetical protein [Candidatus Woesebacteria bacterium]HRT40085.1 hypothetical protein [Candidatus Woesebacteria bacterium]